MTILEGACPVVGGVDTHLDVHVAAAVDGLGGLLGVRSFPTTPAGYHALSLWLCSFGTVDRVGVEGTGTYGAGLARHLAASGVTVIEVDRRQARYSAAGTQSGTQGLRLRFLTHRKRVEARCSSVPVAARMPAPAA
jgi:transposase